jgi:hypothetical protein
MKPTRAQLERQIERAEQHLAERAKVTASLQLARIAAEAALESGTYTLRQVGLADAKLAPGDALSTLGIATAFALVPPPSLKNGSPFLHVAAYPPDADLLPLLARIYTELWEEYLDSVVWMQEWSEYFERTYHFGEDTTEMLEERRWWVFCLLVLMGDQCGLSGRKLIWEQVQGEWRVRHELRHVTEDIYPRTSKYQEAVQTWTTVIDETRTFDHWRRTKPNAQDLPR